MDKIYRKNNYKDFFIKVITEPKMSKVAKYPHKKSPMGEIALDKALEVGPHSRAIPYASSQKKSGDESPRNPKTQLNQVFFATKDQ